MEIAMRKKNRACAGREGFEAKTWEKKSSKA
jgi:hypothetical protein